MNIQELQSERQKLEKELYELVDGKLEAFRKRTGVCIESVDVEMYDTTTRGEMARGLRSIMVTGVRCRLAL